MTHDVQHHLEAMALLMAEVQSLAASYDVHIQALQVAKADATAALQFQIDTLKSVLAPAILAEGQTVKLDGLTITVVHKETWDSALLHAMAEEVPAIRQCLRDSSYLTYRVHARR